MARFDLVDSSGFVLTDIAGFSVDSDCPECCGEGDWIIGTPCYDEYGGILEPELVGEEWVYPKAILPKAVVVECMNVGCYKFDPESPSYTLDQIAGPKYQLEVPKGAPIIKVCCDRTSEPAVSCRGCEIVYAEPANDSTECPGDELEDYCCWDGCQQFTVDVNYTHRIEDVQTNAPGHPAYTRVVVNELEIVGSWVGSWNCPSEFLGPGVTQLSGSGTRTVRESLSDTRDPSSNYDITTAMPYECPRGGNPCLVNNIGGTHGSVFGLGLDLPYDGNSTLCTNGIECIYPGGTPAHLDVGITVTRADDRNQLHVVGNNHYDFDSATSDTIREIDVDETIDFAWVTNGSCADGCEGAEGFMARDYR